ncbi:MAG: hypothetical protein L6Q66_05945 [Bacteroidia bacterium]|nr:hypothetical protein [Bacteroidia bacterium]
MTQEQKNSVEDFAGCFFSKSEVATIVGLTADDIKSKDFLDAFEKGKLIKEAAIRKSVIDLAINGSSPAQIAALKMIDQSKLDE